MAARSEVQHSVADLSSSADEFLTSLVIEKGRARNTIEAYRRDLLRYERFLAVRGRSALDASDVDILDYLDVLRESGLAPTSVARMLVSARSLHRYLAAEGRRPDDPGALIEAPHQGTGIPKALDTEVVERLLDSVRAEDPVGLRDSALLELLYSSGLRISEATGLSLPGLDFDSRLLRVVGKGSRERIVPVGGVAVRALSAYLDDGRPEFEDRGSSRRAVADAVFLNQRGGRLTRQGAWLILQKRAEHVGLGDVVSPHVLRHSCATHMLDNGADIRAVQEMLGHASISTTQVYTKVANDRLWSVYRDAHPRAQRTS